jgi:predicted dehydrogenase
MSPPAPVRLGLLGCGWIAGNRLRQIAERRLADVAVAADPDPRALHAIRRWAPAARLVPDIDYLQAHELDGVMVSSPSALHCRQAVDLLERGLPVFVQKPVGIGAGEVARVLASAAAADLPLETDLCYRHLNSARAVRAALEGSAIGEPFLVEGWFHNAYRPNAGWSHDVRLAGGGSLMDLGIHLLDLVMWLTGLPLSLTGAALRSRGRPWTHGQLEDFAVLDLALGSGAPVRLMASWDASTGLEAEIRLRFYGEQGILEIGNRGGSFFDFAARLCRGTQCRRLAADDGDAWQAGPLMAWLQRLARRDGYREPPWVKRSTAIIDQAYDLERNREGGESTASGGTVHEFGRKGVMP